MPAAKFEVGEWKIPALTSATHSPTSTGGLLNTLGVVWLEQHWWSQPELSCAKSKPDARVNMKKNGTDLNIEESLRTNLLAHWLQTELVRRKLTVVSQTTAFSNNVTVDRKCHYWKKWKFEDLHISNIGESGRVRDDVIGMKAVSRRRVIISTFLLLWSNHFYFLKRSNHGQTIFV